MGRCGLHEHDASVCLSTTPSMIVLWNKHIDFEVCVVRVFRGLWCALFFKQCQRHNDLRVECSPKELLLSYITSWPKFSFKILIKLHFQNLVLSCLVQTSSIFGAYRQCPVKHNQLALGNNSHKPESHQSSLLNRSELVVAKVNNDRTSGPIRLTCSMKSKLRHMEIFCGFWDLLIVWPWI